MTRDLDLKSTEVQAFQNLINSISSNTIILDKEGIIKLVNGSWKEFTQENPYVGKNFGIGSNYFKLFESLKKYNPKDFNNLKEGFQKVLKNQLEEYNYEYPFPIFGEKRWFLIRVTKLEYYGESFFLVIHNDISKRKTVEKRLQRAFKAAKDGLWDWHLDTNEVYLSPQYYRMLGYEPGEFPSTYREGWKNLTHPEDFKKALKEIEKAIKQGKDYKVEFRMKSKSGNWRWIMSKGKAFEKDAKGKAHRMVGIHTDITERKLANEKLKESEEKYRLITENINDLIYIMDRNFQFTYINEKAFKRELGYTKEDLIGENTMKNVHPADWSIVKEAVKKGLKIGQSSAEYRIRDKKGKYHWIETTAQIIDSKPESFRVLLISREITKRKEAQLKVIESEKKYRELVEVLPDVIFEIDRNLDLIYSNSIGYEKFGYNDEDIEEGLSVLQLVDPAYHLRLIQNMKKLLVGKPSKPKEYLMVKKDGTKFHARIHSTPLFHKNQVIGIIGTLTDISEKKAYEELIKKRNKELFEINRLKTELFRRASHELKTPLVSIKGYTDLILSIHNSELNSKIRRILKEIKKGCYRLENLIEDILKSSELESNKIKFNFMDHDIHELIEEVVKDLRIVAQNRSHKIKLDLKGRCILPFDYEQIKEVISNLIMNAIKFTQPEGLIKITSHSSPRYCHITFKDNGIGFTKHEQEKIFKQFGKIERFGQGWDIQAGGTGLGLYICKKIISLHQGKIWLESAGRNKGSTFHIKLPLKQKKQEVKPPSHFSEKD